MASKSVEFPYSEQDVQYVRKLVYDVLVYTLRKYGIPITDRPSSDYEVNVYKRANFVEIAGLSAIRISLLLRDKWKQMFISRHKSSGFNKETILRFLRQVIVCCPLSWNDTEQSAVETSLALLNEILLFFHHEAINFESSIIMDGISIYILSVISSKQNINEKIEHLIGKIDDVPEYDRWITEFIANFAPSYGCEDVSDYFFEYVKEKWKADTEKESFPEVLTLEELRDYMGFLPDDLFGVIAYDDEDFPESLPLASESVLPDDQESSKIQKLPSISEDCAVGEETRKLHPNLSVNDPVESTLESVLPSDQESSKIQKLPSSSEDLTVAEESHKLPPNRSVKDPVESAQCEGGNKTCSELGIEKALEQIELGAEAVSRASQGAIPKRKRSNKKKKSG